MDTPLSPSGLHRPERPAQWTVGHLRAELVGIPDDVVLAVDVPTNTGITRRYPITGAGYGEGIDPADPLFTGQEYPLTAACRDELDDQALEVGMPAFEQVLDQARAHLSAARDELRSDWAPGKGPDTNEQAGARLDALDLIGQAKAAIDRAKRGRHGDTPGSTPG
jgi:hypothetical protein